MKCSVCKSVSDTYDPYLDVALEIRVRQQGWDELCSWRGCCFSHKRHGTMQAGGEQLLRCCLPCGAVPSAGAGPWPLLGLVVLGSCGGAGLPVWCHLGALGRAVAWTAHPFPELCSVPAASREHRAGTGAVCEVRRAERGERLHVCPVSQGCGGEQGGLLQSRGSPGRGPGHEAPEPAMELSLLPLPPLTAVSWCQRGHFHGVIPLALAGSQGGAVCVA